MILGWFFCFLHSFESLRAVFVILFLAFVVDLSPMLFGCVQRVIFRFQPVCLCVSDQIEGSRT
jgi:hypothetical protein